MELADHNGQLRRKPVVPTMRKSSWLLALDLWRGDGSFRGFVEFALIGAIVLAFLPGDNLSGFAVKSGASEKAALSHAPELSKFSGPSVPLAPRLSDVALDAAYFKDVDEPLRSKLAAALEAYLSHRDRGVTTALRGADPDDRHVLMLRGLELLSIPGIASLEAGIGLLERSIDRGEPRAMAIVGVIKVAGVPGYPRDTTGGRNMLERAAAAGDAPAARVIGEGYVTGWMGMVDPGRAQQYLRLASDRGDGKATFRLGEMLFTGHGVAKNEAEAERLIVKAADAGYVEALAMLGAWRLIPFLSGITDNPEEALGWLEQAAAKDEPHAMHYLGMFHIEYGKRIGRLDIARGVALFRRCAETTLDRECLFAYATALDLGLGTTRDPVRAYAMYVLSGAGGKASKAQPKRDELGKTLSSEEIVRANIIVTQMVQSSNAAGKTASGAAFP
jgi:TPR repeat protein